MEHACDDSVWKYVLNEMFLYVCPYVSNYTCCVKFFQCPSCRGDSIGLSLAIEILFVQYFSLILYLFSFTNLSRTFVLLTMSMI